MTPGQGPAGGGHSALVHGLGGLIPQGGQAGGLVLGIGQGQQGAILGVEQEEQAVEQHQRVGFQGPQVLEGRILQCLGAMLGGVQEKPFRQPQEGTRRPVDGPFQRGAHFGGEGFRGFAQLIEQGLARTIPLEGLPPEEQQEVAEAGEIAVFLVRVFQQIGQVHFEMREGPAGCAAPVEAPVSPVGEHGPLNAVAAVDGGIVQVAVDLEDRILAMALGLPRLQGTLPILGFQHCEGLRVVSLGLAGAERLCGGIEGDGVLEQHIIGAARGGAGLPVVGVAKDGQDFIQPLSGVFLVLGLAAQGVGRQGGLQAAMEDRQFHRGPALPRGRTRKSNFQVVIRE